MGGPPGQQQGQFGGPGQQQGQFGAPGQQPGQQQGQLGGAPGGFGAPGGGQAGGMGGLLQGKLQKMVQTNRCMRCSGMHVCRPLQQQSWSLQPRAFCLHKHWLSRVPAEHCCCIAGWRPSTRHRPCRASLPSWTAWTSSPWPQSGTWSATVSCACADGMPTLAASLVTCIHWSHCRAQQTECCKGSCVAAAAGGAGHGPCNPRALRCELLPAAVD